MPDPRDIQSELSSQIEGDVFADEKRRDLYSRAACLYRQVPRAVVRPATAADVPVVVRYAAARGVPITSRGAGSSVAGGAVGNGIVLDLSRLDTIRQEEDAVEVGAGVRRDDLERELAARGRSFPVNPSSGGWCTVGGMVMTNASGPHSFLYGSTRDWVQSIEAVTAQGELHRFGRDEKPGNPLEERLSELLREGASEIDRDMPRAPKCSSGYWLWDDAGGAGGSVPVLCGSEGTLAVATSVRLKTLPSPGARRTALLHPRSLEEAVDVICLLREAGISALEMLDENVVRLLREHGTGTEGLLPEDPNAVLVWLDADGDSPEVADAILDAAVARVRSVPGRLLETPEEAGRLRELRRVVSTLLKQVPQSGRRPARFIEDGCVPPEFLHSYVRALREILQEADLEAAPTFGHAGQGHLHCNPAIDLADPSDRSRLAALVQGHAELVHVLGGVPSGEHGDGRLRASNLEELFPNAWPWMQKIKAVFDPDGVLNPCVKVPPPGGLAPGPLQDLDPAMADLRMDSLAHRTAFLQRVLHG